MIILVGMFIGCVASLLYLTVWSEWRSNQKIKRREREWKKL